MTGRDRSVFALLGVLVYLLCVAGYLLFSATGSTFPWVPTVSLGVGLLLLGTVVSGVGTARSRSRFVLGVSVALVLYRTWISYRRAGSLIGIDTDGFARWGQRAVESGDATAIGSPFYENAPVFHTAIGQVSAVTGLGVDSSVEILSYVIAAVVPLLAFLLAARTTDSRDAAALAALFTALLAVHLERAIWPVAQSYGMVFFLLVLYLALGRSRHRPAMRGLFVLLLFVMAFTHKLLVFGTLLAVLGVYLAQRIRNPGGRVRATVTAARTGPVSQRQAGLYVLVTAVVLVGQWFYLTEWGGIAVRDLLVLSRVGIDLGTGATPGVTGEVPSAASPPDVGLLGVFAHRTHALVVLAVGGLAWLYLALRQRAMLPMLAVTALFVFLLAAFGLPVLVGASIQNPVRIYYLASILVVVLIAAAVAATLEWDGPVRRVVPVALVAGLLVLQAFSAAAVVDLPGQDRVFLEDSEVHAKSFTNQYADGAVYTDSYYASESVAFGPERARTPEYRAYDECLLDRTNCAVDGAHITIRSGVDVYRGWGNRWAADTYTLDWEPATASAAQHSQIYSSGTVQVFEPSG